MKDEQSAQTPIPAAPPVNRLPFVTEEEVVPPSPVSVRPTPAAPPPPTAISSVPVIPGAPGANLDSGSFPPVANSPATPPVSSSVVPPVMSPPVKKNQVPMKFIVGGAILIFLLISVPLGLYLLMNQNQDTRGRATYQYMAPDPTQNQAPLSTNSESLNSSTPQPPEDQAPQPVATPSSLPDTLSPPAVSEGGLTQ